jgi:hypothetical protein
MTLPSVPALCRSGARPASSARLGAQKMGRPALVNRACRQRMARRAEACVARCTGMTTAAVGPVPGPVASFMGVLLGAVLTADRTSPSLLLSVAERHPTIVSIFGADHAR